MSSARTILPGSSQPAIQGLVDQQLVRGTVFASALGGGPSGIYWRGDGPGALAVAAPFNYSLDTTLLSDGPHRVDAYTAGGYNSLSDYLFLRVDNTAPIVSAGPNQNVAIGRSAVLLPNARDTNGIASLSVSFGDQTTTATQAAAEIGQPIRHVYAKGGTFTETVTATDAAGNVSSATAAIHVISKLSEQVAGKIPATFKQAKKLKKRKNLSVKFTSHLAGELSVHVLNSSSKQKAVAMLTFAAVDAKATLTLASKKWPKGRYTVVLQFTDAAGSPGPVVLQPLRIR
jgi:PKD repeat protein